MHGFFEVDGIQNFQPVAEMQKHFSAFVDNAAFRVSNHEADRVFFGCALHQIGFQPKPGLAGAGAADNQHIFVPGCLGVGRTVVHSQALRLGEDDVVCKHRVNIGPDVLRRTP